MKELIKMKPNYSVKHYEITNENFFVSVCNYNAKQYEICHFGFLSKELLLEQKYAFDIGCWQPKGTKEQELKSK